MLDDFVEGEDPTDQNTLVFKLDVECPEESPNAVKIPGIQFAQGAYSRDLEWQPQGDQLDRFPGE